MPISTWVPHAQARVRPGEARRLSNDLRQLGHSPDFWAPMLVLAALFFVIIPTVLLLTITSAAWAR